MTHAPLSLNNIDFLNSFTAGKPSYYFNPNILLRLLNSNSNSNNNKNKKIESNLKKQNLSLKQLIYYTYLVNNGKLSSYINELKRVATNTDTRRTSSHTPLHPKTQNAANAPTSSQPQHAVAIASNNTSSKKGKTPSITRNSSSNSKTKKNKKNEQNEETQKFISSSNHSSSYVSSKSITANAPPKNGFMEWLSNKFSRLKPGTQKNPKGKGKGEAYQKLSSRSSVKSAAASSRSSVKSVAAAPPAAAAATSNANAPPKVDFRGWRWLSNKFSRLKPRTQENPISKSKGEAGQRLLDNISGSISSSASPRSSPKPGTQKNQKGKRLLDGSISSLSSHLSAKSSPASSRSSVKSVAAAAAATAPGAAASVKGSKSPKAAAGPGSPEIKGTVKIVPVVVIPPKASAAAAEFGAAASKSKSPRDIVFNV